MHTTWGKLPQGEKFIASYSGGKDSTLALYHAMQHGEALGLIIMLEEHGLRSRSHAMPLSIIHAQAEAIGLPIRMAKAQWQDYETEFSSLLHHAQTQGAQALVTGDLDLPEDDCWHHKMTQQAHLNLYTPLWQRPHLEVIHEFISLGFETMIVTVNLKLGMTANDLGKILTHSYIETLIHRGIDPCGEGGEFHTTVLDGPLFKNAIPVSKGEILYHGDYAFLPLKLEHQ